MTVYDLIGVDGTWSKHITSSPLLLQIVMHLKVPKLGRLGMI